MFDSYTYCICRKLPSYVDANIWIGGKFDFVKGNCEYVGGEVYVKLCLWVHTLNVNDLRRKIMTYMTHMYNKSTMHFSIWYKRKGMNLTNGRMKVETQEDIDRIANGRDKYNRVDIYVIMENTPSTRPTTSTRPNTSSRPNVLASVKTEKTTPEKKPQMSPYRRSPKFATNLSDPDVILLGHEWDEVNIPQTCREPVECKNTPPPIPKTVKATKFEPPKSVQQVPPSPQKKNHL